MCVVAGGGGCRPRIGLYAAQYSFLLSLVVPRCFRPAFRDDLARLDGASAGPIRVRSFGFCTGERMPAERTTMRHVREVLRLTAAGVGLNEIARRVGVAPSTVRLTLKRLARAGLSSPLPGEMTDTALETALFAAAAPFAAAGTQQG